MPLASERELCMIGNLSAATFAFSNQVLNVSQTGEGIMAIVPGSSAGMMGRRHGSKIGAEQYLFAVFVLSGHALAKSSCSKTATAMVQTCCKLFECVGINGCSNKIRAHQNQQP